MHYFSLPPGTIMITNYDDESSAEGSDDEVVVGLIIQATEIAAMHILKSHDVAIECTDRGQTPKRLCRKIFDSEWAWKCIQFDYLGTDALFGKDFSMMFCLS